MEDLLEFIEAATNWASIPLGLSLVLLVSVGTGLWKPARKRAFWALGLGLVALCFYFGVERGEWGEALFNGQLL